ncbi:MAG: CvpA family protein [Planctomycetota bacterium]|nr:CvpA family protein [Planctomycetota bacterium]
MNVLDYVLLAILLVFLVSGYRKGFILQTLSIVGILVAFFVASYYHAPLANTTLFEDFRADRPTASLVISFLCIFFLTAGVTGLLAHWIRGKTQKKGRSGLDRSFGGLLGVAGGAVLLGSVALGLQQWGMDEGVLVPAGVQEKGRELIAESWMVPKLTDSCLALIALIPQGGREEIARAWRENDGWLRNLDRRKDAGGAPAGVDKIGSADAAGAPPRPPALPGLGTLRKLHAEEREAAPPTPATGTPAEPESPAARSGESEPATDPGGEPESPAEAAKK